MDDNDHNMKMFNIAKEQLLNRLVKLGYLTKNQAEEFTTTWQFVLYKPKWYEKWAKMSNFKEKSMDNTFVKLVEFEQKDEALELIVNHESENE